MIDDVDQYEAILHLCDILIDLNVNSTKALLTKVARKYGDEFERCADCDEPHCECGCRSRDRYSMYDDEAQFE